MSMKVLSILILFGLIESTLSAFTFTLKIRPRDMQCFYQPLDAGQYLEIDFQVIEGGGLDIDCYIKDPNLRSFKTFQRTSEGYHTFVADMSGDYSVCFDNSFSSIIPKLVYFIFQTSADDKFEKIKFSPEEVSNYEFDGQLQNLEDKLNSINNALNQIITAQRHLRGREIRHRKTAENNFERVNFFSVAQIIVLLVIAGIQVGMVRVFFREKRGRTHI